MSKCPWTPAELRARYEAGYSYGKLAKEAGVSRTAVYYWMHDAGIPARPRGGIGTRGGRLETRHCAECGKAITRYATRFVTPPDRTFCCRACSTTYWRKYS
jgi:hypothetical protein